MKKYIVPIMLLGFFYSVMILLFFELVFKKGGPYSLFILPGLFGPVTVLSGIWLYGIFAGWDKGNGGGDI